MSKKLTTPHLPLEIITIILSKLSIKPLLQFKCVSKTWLSLISSSEFAKLHLQQMKQNNTLSRRIFMSTHQRVHPEAYSDDIGDHENGLVSEDDAQTYPDCTSDDENAAFVDYNLPIMSSHQSFDPESCFDHNGHYQNAIFRKHDLTVNDFSDLWDCFGVVGSCDGLVCVRCDSYLFQQIVVFNPTTRQVRLLPKSDISIKGTVYCGIGYDSKIDDYKIVRCVMCTSDDRSSWQAKTEIFNLKGNSWRTIQNHDCNAHIYGGNCVFLNGALHWINKKFIARGDLGNEYECEMVRFDVVEERFLDETPLPSHIGHNELSPNLMLIDECLCVYTQWFADDFGAWKMMTYGDHDSWTRIYQFSSDIFPICYLGIGFLCVTKSGHLLFDKDLDYLIFYLPKDESIELIGHEGENWTDSIVYTESLVSPNIAD